MERVTEARPKAEWIWLSLCGAAYLIALLLTGCSGSDAESSSGRGNKPPTGGGSGGAGGTSGESGASGSAGTGDFGNPDGGTIVYDGGAIDSGFGENPDDIDCGGTEVEPMIMMETIPGNVLLVFDRSGSMAEDFSDADTRPRWEVAREAVFNAIDPLKDVVNVAAIFFPHAPACPGDSCCVPELGTAPQIDFMPGADFLAAWESFWMTAPEVDGSTPTLEALQVAGNALAARAGALEGTTTVVLITDGDPRCALDLGSNTANNNPTPEQVADRVTQLSVLPAQLLNEGINTHVLGLPGTEAAHAVTVLNGIAAAGGTTEHISAADPMLLQNEIAAIVGESVTTSFDSCSIGLPHEPPDNDEVVLVVVEGGVEQSVDRDLGDGGGWTLVGSGADMSIILQGELCNQARAGAYDKISVVFGCVDLPPLEPPEPPM